MKKKKIMHYDYSDLLTHKEAAAFIEMTPELFRYYINDDRGPEPVIICGHVYYHRASLKEWSPREKPRGRPKKKTNQKEN